MAGKLDGTAIVSGSITAEQLAPGAGGGPKITSIDYPGNTTAVLPTGGEIVSNATLYTGSGTTPGNNSDSDRGSAATSGIGGSTPGNGKILIIA